MNVRSPSSEGGGTLLPFRGQRGDGYDGSAGSESSDTSTAPGRTRAVAATAPSLRSPTVVDLSWRRGAAIGRRERPWRGAWVRLAVVVSCVVAVVGGATVAALSGALPLTSDAQQRRPAVSAPPTTVGGVEGDFPAAYGLCTAFDRAVDRGDDVATAAAFRNLARAAGGSTRVSAYCAAFEDLSRGRAR